MMCYTE